MFYDKDIKVKWQNKPNSNDNSKRKVLYRCLSNGKAEAQIH